MTRVAGLLPGVALAAVLAAAAWSISPQLRPIVAIDATFLALLLGLSAGALSGHPAAVEPGAQRSLKWGLLIGVILLGAQIDIAFLLSAGLRAVALAAALIAFTLAAFWLFARLLKVEGDTWALLGAGTGICGLGAVAAAGASLQSRKEDIAVAVAAIGLLSAVGLLLYPLIGTILSLPPDVYGAWAGLSVHAVANAVAAGLALGDEAGRVATVTKLARVALLAPALLALTFLVRHKAKAKRGKDAFLPPMVWGFVLVALVASFLPVPEVLLSGARVGAKVLLIFAMAALGLTTRVGHFQRAGAKGMGLAVAGWVVLSCAALVGALLLYR